MCRGHTYINVPSPFCKQYSFWPALVQRPRRAFEASSPVCLSALNISVRADGAQMDSKVGASLKIHGTHRDQDEWRGMALNIKLLPHTHTHWGWGRWLLVTTGSVPPIGVNWEQHLLGLSVRFLLIQLSDKCSLGFIFPCSFILAFWSTWGLCVWAHNVVS